MATTQDNRLLRISTPLGKDFLLVNKLSASEGLSEMFSVDAAFFQAERGGGTEPTMVDASQILGKRVTGEIARGEGPSRYINGIVNRLSQGVRHVRFTFYNVSIVPEVWLLTQCFQSRIFQHKTVPQILEEVLEGFNFKIELQGDFKPRNYCAQYQETDWDFISRLMEEEGIFYFFEHSDGNHQMIIANDPRSHRDCPNKNEIPFFTRVEGDDLVSSVLSWHKDYQLMTGKVTFWDYNFELPTQKLDAEQPSRFTIGGNGELEVYDFPGGYARKYDGIDKGGSERASDLNNIFDDKRATAERAMQALDARHETIRGISDCPSLTSGHLFRLTDHPSSAQNGQYLLTHVAHSAVQSPGYVSDAPGSPYECSFSAIAHGAGKPPFRPMRSTAKPKIFGTQTATVVGPAGEEIFTDKYGRVKVQFNWDRTLKFDPDSSCWVRVARDIAGNKWGTMFIPRIGQEVIVDFEHGDPDKPIIVGSVYNPQTMPHYELPQYKTLTYIKTRTSPDDGKGYNELRFEDKADKEQVFIRSQKRYDLRVRGSMYETCGGSRHEVIGLKQENQPGGNLAITVAGCYDLHVKEDHFIGIDGKQNETVKADVVENYQGKQYTEVTGARELNAREITLEALSKVTLKVGGSFISLDLSGVTISGPMVKINSGGSGSSTGQSDISDPLDADVSDNGEPGYLERPRSGGGGGRRTRTLSGQHAPNVTAQAFALTQARGTADDMDRALVAAELSKLPPHVLQRMEDNGTTVAVCRDSVTEVRTDLAGVTPRGWPPGTSWDTVPGLYDPGTNTVIVATRGHDQDDGPYVPPTGDGHGSSNLVIHEAMHSVDHHGPDGNHISETDENFVNARNNDPAIMADGYEGTANPAGAEEAYAESAARYYGGDPNDATNHPGLHEYWEGDPLNPTPPAAAGP